MLNVTLIALQIASLLPRLFGWVVLASCVFTLTGFAGGAGWWVDLTSHFRVQYLLLQAVALILLLWRRRGWWKPWLGIVGLMFLLNLLQVLPFESVHTPYARPDTPRLSILHMNVLLTNRNHQAVLDEIQHRDADIVSLQEVWKGWPAVLDKASVLQRYPYHVFTSAAGNRLYSKLPLHNVRRQPVNEKRLKHYWKSAILYADTTVGEAPLTLIALHPPVPVLPPYRVTMETYIAILRAARPRWQENAILIGDLNTTPWSVFYREYLKATGLKDARLGAGLHPTWPAYFPALFIPIDHVLISERFEVLKYESGPDIGSDHLPVYVELGLKE